MNTWQWVLLVVGAATVVTIYWLGRRGRPAARREAPVQDIGAALRAQSDQADRAGAGGEQDDLFTRVGEFDEFGVGRPRRRSAPTMDDPTGPTTISGPEPVPAAKANPSERIVTLLIAEPNGQRIAGHRVHAALRAQGLKYGEHRIYHRMDGGLIVYSVASLVKPGVLDPAEEGRFETPGLSMFMQLPGPHRPDKALADMLRTAHALARQLGAELYSDQRKRMTAEDERALAADIDTWQLALR